MLRAGYGRYSSQFLSTLSLRRATGHPAQTQADQRDFYPRSPCGERHYDGDADRDVKEISIHALLAESDGRRKKRFRRLFPFLSTLSLRRATGVYGKNGTPKENFYPRSPCGERHIYLNGYKAVTFISIHALLAESDIARPIALNRFFLFLSTLSLRRATWGCHTLPPYFIYFYPRSPCGERLIGNVHDNPELLISIHALLAESDRGAEWLAIINLPISIHALLAESDTLVGQEMTASFLFLSTLSLRRATRYIKDCYETE